MTETKIDELTTKPKAMLVHNPALSGVLSKIDKANHLEMLFPLTPNPKKAIIEHANFTKLLEDQGIEVIELFDLMTITDKKVLKDDPNLIFTRDPVITLPWLPKTIIIGQMRKKVRSAEPMVYENFALKLGFEKILHTPPDVFIEGGDVIPMNLNGKRIIIIRTGGRSSASAVKFLLNPDTDLCDSVLEVHCNHKTLHLDSVMGICGQNTVVCDRAAINKGALHTASSSVEIDIEDCLSLAGLEVLPVSFEEADRLQATNFINLGADKVIAYSGCQRIIKELENRGIRVRSFEGHELAKGRGGPRCLTRPIY